MRCFTRGRGYTLVELLVVITIIGILISLSVPAVLSVRKAMNRAQCEENLRQLGIATTGYVTSRGSLPGYIQKYGEFAGGVDPADPGNYGGNVPPHQKIGTWHVAVLGHLDHAPYYEQWTLDRYPLLSDGRGQRRATSEGYSLAAAPNLTIFQCASASGSLAVHGLNNYVANTGMHADAFPFRYRRPGDVADNIVTFARSMSRVNAAVNNQLTGFDPSNPARVVPAARPVRLDDFKDGLAATMLITENQQAQPWYLTRLTGNASHLVNTVTVGGKELTVYPPESRYLQGAVWHYEDDQLFAGAPAVRAQHKINGGDVYNTFMDRTNYSDVARPSSLHVGGVNMMMADGSVRFVGESIDYRVYQALMTPSGRSSDVPMNEFPPPQGL